MLVATPAAWSFLDVAIFWYQQHCWGQWPPVHQSCRATKEFLGNKPVKVEICLSGATTRIIFSSPFSELSQAKCRETGDGLVVKIIFLAWLVSLNRMEYKWFQHAATDLSSCWIPTSASPPQPISAFLKWHIFRWYHLLSGSWLLCLMCTAKPGLITLFPTLNIQSGGKSHDGQQNKHIRFPQSGTKTRLCSGYFQMFSKTGWS